MGKKKETFEASLEALEKVVGKLEDGGSSLEDALKLFEQGRGHAKKCEAKLNDIERKMQVLLEDKNGQPVLEDRDERDLDAAPADESRDDFPG